MLCCLRPIKYGPQVRLCGMTSTGKAKRMHIVKTGPITLSSKTMRASVRDRPTAVHSPSKSTKEGVTRMLQEYYESFENMLQECDLPKSIGLRPLLLMSQATRVNEVRPGTVSTN